MIDGQGAWHKQIYYDPLIGYQGACNVVTTTNCSNGLTPGNYIYFNGDAGTIFQSCDLPNAAGRFLFTSAYCN